MLQVLDEHLHSSTLDDKVIIIPSVCERERGEEEEMMLISVAAAAETAHLPSSGHLAVLHLM